MTQVVASFINALARSLFFDPQQSIQIIYILYTFAFDFVSHLIALKN